MGNEILETAQQVTDQAVITQTWMLGIFGSIIVFLVGLLVSIFRQGAKDSKEAMVNVLGILEKFKEKLADHETRITVQESKTP